MEQHWHRCQQRGGWQDLCNDASRSQFQRRSSLSDSDRLVIPAIIIHVFFQKNPDGLHFQELPDFFFPLRDLKAIWSHHAES